MHSHPVSAKLVRARPFLKWAGGKQRLTPQLLPLIGSGRRLIEPFLGAGSVFLAAGFDEAILGDANADLMALWAAVQARPEALIHAANEWFQEKYRNALAYFALRDQFNMETDRFDRAVLFFYLNKFGFNGLCRYNRDGAFNVPYGKPTRLPSVPTDEIAAAHLALQRARLMSGGYAESMREAGAGDVVYCDPPYLASVGGASFAAYTCANFGISEHLDLVREAHAAASRGARVLISNHDTPQTRDLYRAFTVVPVYARRSVAANAQKRGVAQELVAILE